MRATYASLLKAEFSLFFLFDKVDQFGVRGAHSSASDVAFLFVRSRRDATRKCYTWQCGCFQYVALSSWQSCRILRSGPLYSVATWHRNSIGGPHDRTWLSSIITNDIIRIIYGGALRIESRITAWAISVETSRPPPCLINYPPARIPSPMSGAR